MVHYPRASVSLMFAPHFDVFCDPLLNGLEATWNVFVLYNDQKEQGLKHIPASYRLFDCSRIWASLGIF